MPSGEPNQGDAPGWELFKENAQPLKKGRDAAKLGKSLTARATSQCVEQTSITQRAEFESSVSPEALAASADPLADWLRFVHWAREEDPSGSSQTFELLERCTRAFTHDPRFQNDERFIGVRSLVCSFVRSSCFRKFLCFGAFVSFRQQTIQCLSTAKSL